MRPFIIVVIFLFIAEFGFSQAFFLSSINPEDGKVTNISSISGFLTYSMAPRATSLNTIEGNYIVYAWDTTYSDRLLYSIDVTSGKTIYDPPLPDTNNIGNYVELEMNNKDGKMYGIFWDSSDSLGKFVSIDPTTGGHSVIDTLSEFFIPRQGTSGIDTAKDEYLVVGIDNSYDGNRHLFKLDINSGRIISKKSMLKYDMPNDLQYNQKSGELVGNTNGRSSGAVIKTLDTSSGNFSTLVKTDIVGGIYNRTVAISEKMQRYYITGVDSMGDSALYTIDIQNKKVHSKVPFKVWQKDHFGFDEFVYDDNTDRLYALNLFTKWPKKEYQWPTYTSIESSSSGGHVSLYPNPTQGNLVIEFERNYLKVELLIKDMIGRIESVNVHFNVDKFDEKITGPSGMYYVEVIGDGNFLGTYKVIKQ